MGDEIELTGQQMAAGHMGTYDEWADSEAGKEWLKDADKRSEELAAKEEEAQKPVEQDAPKTPATEAEFSEEDDDKAPAKSANKDEWVAFAVSQGADQAEAESSTKDDLIAKYGG